VLVLQVDAGLPVPEIAKFVVPLGATPPATPVTVAVKVNTPPKVGVRVEVIPTLGAPDETTVAFGEVTAATG